MSITSALKTTLGNILLESNSLSVESDLKKLILDHQSSRSCLEYILQELSQDIRKFDLFTYFIQAISKSKRSFDIFTELFTMLQGYINQRNFNDILNVFGEISKSFSLLDQSNKNDNMIHIETAMGFCLFNLKETEAIFQQIGALCLLKLITHAPLSKTIIKTAVKNIIDFIENTDFKAHCELLSALDILIERANRFYSPYATVTLYKALDFLAESEDSKRRLALKIIYDLVFYCNAEVFDLKSQIIEFVTLLKGDRNEEVREICSLILGIINQPSRQCSFEKTEEVLGFNKESVLLNEVIVSEENVPIENNVNDNNKEEKINEIKANEFSNSESYQMKQKLFNDKTDYDYAHKTEIDIDNDKDLSNNATYNNNSNGNDDNIKSDDESIYYENQITELLKKMKEMSDEQIHLTDLITSLKISSHNQIAKLNERITTLESLISISISKSKSKPSSSSSLNNQYSSPQTSWSVNAILSKALTSSDHDLISALQEISSLGDLSQVNQTLVEECIMRITTMLSKGSFIHPIIIFLKHCLISIKFTLKKSLISNLNNKLSYITSPKESKLNDEDIIDIILIQSCLQSQNGSEYN